MLTPESSSKDQCFLIHQDVIISTSPVLVKTAVGEWISPKGDTRL